jgi:hypothetical protein
MTALSRQLFAVACTLVMSATCLAGAIAPATPHAVAAATRLAA